MVGSAFIPQCFGHYQQGVFRFIQQNTAGTHRNNLYSAVSNQEINDLGRSRGADHRWADTDGLPVEANLLHPDHIRESQQSADLLGMILRVEIG